MTRQTHDRDTPRTPPAPGDDTKTDTNNQDPWFGVELPPSALAMNDSYVELPPACEQSELEILDVVHAVRD